jgi:hypothetical protein
MIGHRRRFAAAALPGCGVFAVALHCRRGELPPRPHGRKRERLSLLVSAERVCGRVRASLFSRWMLEEGGERGCGLSWLLLGEEVPTVDRPAGYVVGEFAPERQWAAFAAVPG